ncbi:hypothetical protein [Sporofaciens sp. SGI.106]|uniref:hypothetical protein n=1 Tax=Sporofaciens sp. SGI.106 TaxID=3420568 RepID=UPI003D072940
MAQKVLIMGESGTGKSTSMRNCDAAITAVVNPVGKPLPFKNHFDMLNNETDARKIIKYMKDQAAAGKKIIVVDDFQYILAVPYMNRIKETGWDKYNDFGANYFEIIDVCKDLPDDVVVVYMTHLETLDNGLTTVKLIGKLLREKITIEGLFTVVLRTGVNEAKYYFYTQNSGKDTVKSPLGMFPAYAIENDLNYVVDKIRNYYEIGEYKSDAEMTQADQAAATELEKPDANGRRSRSRKTAKEEPEKASGTRKTRSEVQAENEQKQNEYMEQVNEAIDKATGGAEEVPFEEAAAIADTVPKPDLQKPPRRTRKERQTEQSVEPTVCDEDTYFYIPDDDNYVLKHKGDESPKGGKVITEDEFNAGIKRISQENSPAEGVMDPHETPARGQRRRRTR